MSAKQDRTPARTAADLERRLNLGKSFGEAMGIATDARAAADRAIAEANACRSQIIELADSIKLEVTGGEAGNTASIVLTVGKEQYSGEINLKGLVTFESLQESGTTQINGDNIVSEGVDENGDKVRFTLNGGKVLFEKETSTGFEIAATFYLNNTVARIIAEQGLNVCGRRDSYFGAMTNPTYLQGEPIYINGRRCYWEYQGGEYVLKGENLVPVE